ncbi:GntR family transcriptional regulator [Pseudoclavibacter sp. JAI123]|uniref:GntR family transcriptional regulator n=1 Tax=Pseudoclavibacter sp. JAI123 TaxID=2723065 RepID=UPI0015CC9B2D|nr:GntR family transcriptional regulator [Pseudoclavibacter sp. JAI123]NYF14250.1 GntR family transcriptional regulator [Pseudoclavibacter sp. JAI123]
MANTIDRTSPVPYYEQLAAILKRRIQSGEFPLDERMPSEFELGREFGLSRATIRQTLSTLESEGYARRVARRGVFASTPEESSGWIVQDTEGFLESQIRHGRTGITTRVVDAGFAVPPAHAAEALGIAEGAEVFAIERVRTLDGVLAMFSTNWFPREIGEQIAAEKDVLDGSASVNAALRKAGFSTSGARRVVHALGAPASVAEHVGVPEGQPILRVRSLSWDQRDTKFDYYETWVLTDTVPLEINVAAS